MMRRRALALALAALLPTAAAAQDSSGLTALDDRGELFGWEAVGRVEVAPQGYCTGALIAPDLVLTAAHCLFTPEGERIEPAAITFRAGYRNGLSVADRKVTFAAPDPAFVPDAEASVDQLRADLALLRLDAPIPSFTAAPFALHEGAVQGGAVSVVSYGQGRDEVLSWQRSCRVLTARDGVMAFDCDVTFGSSGAPVFVRDGGRARILTLVSAGGDHDGRPIAFGMELPASVARLRSHLRSEEARAALTSAPGASAGAQGLGPVERRADGAKFLRP